MGATVKSKKQVQESQIRQLLQRKVEELQRQAEDSNRRAEDSHGTSETSNISAESTEKQVHQMETSLVADTTQDLSQCEEFYIDIILTALLNEHNSMLTSIVNSNFIFVILIRFYEGSPRTPSDVPCL